MTTFNNLLTKNLLELTVLASAINRKNASKQEAIVNKRAKDLISLSNDTVKLIIDEIHKPNGDIKTQQEREKYINHIITIRESVKKNLKTLGRDDILVSTDYAIKIEYKDKIEKSIIDLTNNSQIITMALTKIEYYNLCARTINYMFNGDPLALTPFIHTIELLESMDEKKEHKTILRDFIISKLQGQAIEVLPENPTIEIIKTTLKEKIKVENSKVIAGKLMALKADRLNFTDYTRKTEDLADQFKRSLVLEGIPEPKANEMVIDRTIELCRSNTQSNIVKSVLSSAKFENAKEVVAKFIIESRTETNENQVLAFKSNRKYSNSNNKYNNNANRGRYNNNPRRYNSNYRSNWYNSNNSNQNGRRRQYYYNNNNNRNNSHNNNRNYNENWRNNSNKRSYNNNNNNNRSNRVYYAENETAPPSGASQAQQVTLRQTDHPYN